MGKEFQNPCQEYMPLCVSMLTSPPSPSPPPLPLHPSTPPLHPPGEFGTVYKGTWNERKPPVPIAVKTLKVSYSTSRVVCMCRGCTMYSTVQEYAHTCMQPTHTHTHTHTHTGLECGIDTSCCDMSHLCRFHCRPDVMHV